MNSAAGFLGPVAKVRAGAARKLFSLKAFRAARLEDARGGEAHLCGRPRLVYLGW